MNKIFSVAIDGPSGAGKSSVAKKCAARLNAIYLDTGAMYRAVGLYMKRQGIDLADENAVIAKLPEVNIAIRYENGSQVIYLNSENVSNLIRTDEISSWASRVSSIPAVRVAMVSQQQEMAKNQSVIMDGRDIGTKVLPNATLKIFLIADAAERANRRYKEYLEKAEKTGETLPSYEAIYEAIIARDLADSTRAASPLMKADDAIEIDSTNMTLEEVSEEVIKLAVKAIGEKQE
ncbi:MAG: (d)CMP kinase [Clostridiales bacterium]|nr:(d)CMP kinase [Clostridiales bacterium]